VVVYGGTGVEADWYNKKDEATRYAILIHPKNQFRFVAWKLKKMFPDDDGTGYKKITHDGDSGYSKKTPQEWAELIAMKFENCAECGKKGTQTLARGGTAFLYATGKLKGDVKTAS
jgi:hypothetical protein